jgi:hypothetical protein
MKYNNLGPCCSASFLLLSATRLQPVGSFRFRTKYSSTQRAQRYKTQRTAEYKCDNMKWLWMSSAGGGGFNCLRSMLYETGGGLYTYSNKIHPRSRFSGPLPPAGDTFAHIILNISLMLFWAFCNCCRMAVKQDYCSCTSAETDNVSLKQ